MQRAFIQKTTITSTALFQSTRNLTTSAFRMSTTHQSHATDPQSGSYVPQKAQEKLPKGVEDTVPDAIHDTGSTNHVSHATGDSKVPEALQKAVPKGVEKALPNSIHDTSGLKE